MAVSEDGVKMQNYSVAVAVKPPTLTSIDKEGRKCLWIVGARAVVWVHFLVTNLSERNVQKAQAAEGASLWSGFVCLLEKI